MDVVFRGITEGDTGFVYNSYLLNFRKSSPSKIVPSKLYFHDQAKVLEDILATSETLIACFPEAPDEIIGYVIFRHMPDAVIIHYIYVKDMHRGRGYGGQLIDMALGDKELIVASHLTDNFFKLRASLAPLRAVYDSHILEKLKALEGAS